LQQEGDVGRQRLTQITRYATVLICLVQGYAAVGRFESPARIFFPGYDDDGLRADRSRQPKSASSFTSVIFMTAGTMLLMWLGEQITAARYR